MRGLRWLLVLAVVAAGAGWWLTRPVGLTESDFAGLTGDAARGEAVFHAAGCASCHAAPEASGEARRVLAGGQRFPSPFGTFLAPNISPDPENGIGDWTLAQFASAVQRGVSPEGTHYYPAFPYTAYARATRQDIADLWAFWPTLPPSAEPSLPHEIGFPFNIRATLGGWKLLFGGGDWAVAGALSPVETRGRYLAEALAHCGECHTPRNALGGLDRARWLAGGPNPAGQGRIPNITPAALNWADDEILTYLTDGQTPDFDYAGGHMALVIDNLAQLPQTDRMALVAYLRRVPPVAPQP
jgi:mono/diheme cytochrome c family protein